MDKVGYRFNRGVTQHTILTLVRSLVPDHNLNNLKPGQIIALRDNALLARRRPELEMMGEFVDAAEMSAASKRQHSGSKGAHGRAKQYSKGTHVNAGLSRRQPFLVTPDTITLSTWRSLVKLLRRHNAVPSQAALESLTPGDPVLLRPQLPSRLTEALAAYGSIEYRNRR